MHLDTAYHLSTETRQSLQELLTLNIDSRDGYQEAADRLEDMTVSALCQTLAMQRGAQAEELARVLELNSVEVDRTGSIAAVVGRIWEGIREAFSADNTLVMLTAAESSEDQILQAYEVCLKLSAGSSVNEVIFRQYAQVKSAHDRIRLLRDEYAETE